MELQLGLALSLPVHHSPTVKGFDARNDGVMALDIWSYSGSLGRSKNKRSFDLAFEKIGDDDDYDESKMSPLLLWHGQKDEEDDDGKRQRKFCSLVTKDGGERGQVVGWPPIKTWRKKMLLFPDDLQNGRHDLQNHQIVAKENDGSANSVYIKVKMEGVGILRKIDIKMHHSYETLRDSLITMFAKYKESDQDEDAAEFTVTYQDKQGDWLIAGDVPWQSFVESVQRLEIVRNGG